MAHHKADGEALTRDELAMMTAFEAYTGDGTSGVERTDLSDSLQTELDDFMQLTQRITALDDVPPVDPSIRGRLLSAAIAQRDAAAEPTGLAKWLVTLLRPAPIAAMGLLAAMIVAVGVRPDDATPTATSAEGGAMVAMERDKGAGETGMNARAAAEDKRAPSTDLANHGATTKTQPAATVAVPAGEKALAAAAPRAAVANDQPRTQRQKLRKRLFAARPASLGPTEQEKGKGDTDKWMERKRNSKSKVKAATKRDLVVEKALAGKGAASKERLVDKDRKGSTKRMGSDRASAKTGLYDADDEANLEDRLADGASHNVANSEDLIGVRQRRPVRQEDATSYAYKAKKRAKEPAKGLPAERLTAKKSRLGPQAPRARETNRVAPTPTQQPAPPAAKRRRAQSEALSRGGSAGGPPAAMNRKPSATPTANKTTDGAVLKLQKLVKTASTTAKRRNALIKLQKLAKARGLKDVATWATQRLAALDASVARQKATAKPKSAAAKSPPRKPAAKAKSAAPSK